MTEKHRLVDDLSDNLAQYRENVENMLRIVVAKSDPRSDRHDPSDFLDSIQELLETDSKFKANMAKIKLWRERQRKIKELEKEFARLSNHVNHFTKLISKKQTELRDFIFKARKLQDDIESKHDVASIQTLIETAHLIGPASSGMCYNWMPSAWQLQTGLNSVETLDLPAPSVATKTFSFGPIVRSRNAAALSFFSDSDSYGDDSDSG